MSDAPRRKPESGQDPTRETRDTTLREAHLERQVLNLFGNWLRRTHEASGAHTEAAIDRASFESFPASDPVAPAAASNDRSPALEEIECTMSPGELVFRCAPSGERQGPDDRPPPAWSSEGDLSDGRRILLRVWVTDAGARDTVPDTLELEPEHASLRARGNDRRSGHERRVRSGKAPGGVERRHALRRVSEGAAPAASAATATRARARAR